MAADDRLRAIGKVVSVSADRLVVELHRGSDNFTVVGFDDVHYVARLGSLVIIPVQSEYVVAEVVGLREKDSTASRPGSDDNLELDKAASAKYLDLVPVGMLPQKRDGAFRFGVSTFPSATIFPCQGTAMSSLISIKWQRRLILLCSTKKPTAIVKFVTTALRW